MHKNCAIFKHIQEKANEASVKLAVSIGLADGNLDKEEGHTIKQWITKIVDSAPDTQKEKVVILGSRFIGDIKRENIYLRTFVANKLFSYLFLQLILKLSFFSILFLI